MGNNNSLDLQHTDEVNLSQIKNERTTIVFKSVSHTRKPNIKFDLDLQSRKSYPTINTKKEKSNFETNQSQNVKRIQSYSSSLEHRFQSFNNRNKHGRNKATLLGKQTFDRSSISKLGENVR